MATWTAQDVFAPARTMLAALAARHVSSLELTEQHLARIAHYNTALNAIVVPAADPLAAAREADAAIARGDDRRLLGLPVTLKESLCGQPATAFPVGLSRAGLPLGLQAIGPYLEDRTPIRFAALASQAMGGFVRPPGYDA